jgi:YD repeat-containing protein
MKTQHKSPAARLAAIAALMLLVGCSGGSDGGSGDGGGGGTPPPPPPPPPASASSRIAAVAWDLDANGAADASTTLAYDSQGRLVEQRYTYTGDGTADAFAGFGTDSGTITFGFDSAGRLATNTQAGATFTFVYGADGRATRADIALPGATGEYLFTYDTAGLLTRLDVTAAGLALSSIAYEHDAAGRRVRSAETTPFDAGVSEETFTWNADGRLTGATSDLEGDTANVRYELLYDGPRQVGTRKFAGSSLLYTVRFEYDSAGRVARAIFDVGGNGSEDATATLSYESGPCVVLVSPLWSPIDTITGGALTRAGDISTCPD